MADNRKYYYLKLKESYFDEDAIVLLESMQDGMLYSNILLKLYLKSLKNGGKLQLAENIPYTAQMIATITRQQVGTVERALQIFMKLGLVEPLQNGALYMSNIELLIGQSSTEGERKRRARRALQEQKALPEAVADKRPPYGADIKETAIMAILNGMYCKKYGHLSTSISLIGYEMTGKFLKTSNKRERTIIDGIKDAIKTLIDKGIIETIDKNNDNYIFSGKGLEVYSNKNKFVVLDQWEMQRIFESANKPFNVFSFFCSLIGTVNNQTKEWHMSQDEMISLWGYGKETVNNYLEQLEKIQLIYVYRHKKRRSNGTYYKLNNSYGRYCDKEAVIAEALKYSDTVECEDLVEKLDRRAIKLRYNAYCDGAKKYNDPAAVIALYKECLAYNKSLKYKPVEGYYDGEYKQGELLNLSVFPDNVRNKVDDNWGEPVSMEHDFTIEEISNMPTEGEVQMNLP